MCKLLLFCIYFHSVKSLPKYLLDRILGTKYIVILTSRKCMPNEFDSLSNTWGSCYSKKRVFFVEYDDFIFIIISSLTFALDLGRYNCTSYIFLKVQNKSNCNIFSYCTFSYVIKSRHYFLCLFHV